jgi:putative membrane protein
MTKGPVVIELDDSSTANPSDAPPILDTPAPTGQAMQSAARLAGHPPSRLTRWFWRVLLALITTWASLAAWSYATALIAANPVLGAVVSALMALFVLICLLIAIKELAGFARLSRIDQFHHMAETALAEEDLTKARKLADQLAKLYKHRPDTQTGRATLRAQQNDIFDAAGVLQLAETQLLSPLDQQAQLEIEAAARQVATVTALVPIAMADMVAALTANLRMIRRIAEIYGGRSGVLGGWRLTRAVLSHLVATGALAVGDDMLEPLVGGGLLGKLSRRFGEGMVNGALTARVGIAAIEVCRPLPFTTSQRPSSTTIVRRALTGLFQSSKSG